MGRQRPMTWGRKDEEYIADFYLISRRTLDEFEHRLFRCHFLLGADWKLCARTLGIDRGNFFHAVYRIEQKLGRVFREVEPYALFPVDEYFHGPSRFGPAGGGPKELKTPVPICRIGLAGTVEHVGSRPSRLRFPEPLGRTA
jgi:hypothetical protein